MYSANFRRLTNHVLKSCDKSKPFQYCEHCLINVMILFWLITIAKGISSLKTSSPEILATAKVIDHPNLVWKYLSAFKSVSTGRSGFDVKIKIFNIHLLTGIYRSTCDNALRWMPHDLTNSKSILVQMITWFHQATSHRTRIDHDFWPHISSLDHNELT